MTAREKIRLCADALAEVLPTTVPLLVALERAGAREPACRAQHEAVSARRRANMHLFAADLRATGQLRADLTDDRVADLVWSVNSPECFTLLTAGGHTPEQYADLVADVWTRTLLTS